MMQDILRGVPKSEIEPIILEYDHAINYAFQQNAIPIIKELRFRMMILSAKI